MAEPRFTPGPWRRVASGLKEKLLIVGPDGLLVVSVAVFDERGRANAELIAASPDMLAIVQRVAEHFKDTDAPLGTAAREVLAKMGVLRTDAGAGQ